MRSVAPQLKCANPHVSVPLTAQRQHRSRTVSCNAASIDASDSESEGGMRLERGRGASLPSLEHWSDDEGMLPVRHPGSFPYAGTTLQSCIMIAVSVVIDTRCLARPALMLQHSCSK